MPLAKGQNTLWVEATDAAGASSKEVFTVDFQASRELTNALAEGTNYMLVIGVDKYENWGELYNAKKDARDLRNELVSRYDFDHKNITTIFDDKATEKNILGALKDLSKKVKPQDNLLIFYSGHGHFDEELKEGYWVPVDGEVGDVSGYIANSQVQKYLREINTQHTMLIADACFSGSMLSERRGFVENVARFKSRRALVSGRLEVVSDGMRGQNSPFMDAMLTYLRNNSSPVFAASQMEQYVKMTVANNTDQLPQNGAIMNVGDKGGEFVFKLKK